MSLFALSLAIASSLVQQGPPAEPLHPVLVEFSNFIGGTWVAEFPKKEMGTAEFTYDWAPDKRGVRGSGIIGKGGPNPVHVWNQFGLDAREKKVYYLDSHGSETVYFGYLNMEGKDFVYEFGPAGGDMKSFSSRGTFTDKDTYVSKIRNAKGEEVVTLTFRRRR